jgi:outer membrane protein insertion porin family
LHLGGSVTSSGSLSSLGPQLPRSERLFLDNALELRGFQRDAFGPADAMGRPVGGDVKLLGTAELEIPLVRRIGLSAIGFMDVGSIAGSGQTVSGRSLGAGFLWRSPIGPLKFSWALPLDGGKPGFVFGFGGGF